MKLGERTYFDFDAKNYSQMRGFLVPVNIKDRDSRNVDVRNYLEPICSDVITQYANKNVTITQNPGWEE